MTDAQVVSGVLRTSRFFGGQMTLREDLARTSLEGLGLGAAEAAADMVLRIVNGTMAGAVQLVSTARGYDTQEFALVAYAGGGPVHAASAPTSSACAASLSPGTRASPAPAACGSPT